MIRSFHLLSTHFNYFGGVVVVVVGGDGVVVLSCCYNDNEEEMHSFRLKTLMIILRCNSACTPC